MPHTPPQILAGRKSLPRTLGGGDVLAPAAVREQYQRRTSLGGGGEDKAGPPLRRAAEGADCPVCFDVSLVVIACCACSRSDGSHPLCALPTPSLSVWLLPASQRLEKGGERISFCAGERSSSR